MAARALTAAAAAAGAGRRVAGRTAPPLLASCRRGGMNHSTSAQPEERGDHIDGRAAAAAMTGAQVEAALNSKNVEVLQGEEHVATVLPGEAIGAGGALETGGAGEDASWVPDQETGVFVPADVDTAAHGGAPPAPPHPPGGGGSSSSVLDQTVFVRDDMEDVERPAIDMANADANDTKN